MKTPSLTKAILLLSISCFITSCEFKIKTDIATGAPQFAIDHYAINVSDMSRSVGFYKNIFDLKEIKNGTGLDHIRWFRLGTSEELHIIEVDSLDKKLPKGVHLALRTGDLERFRESLTNKNIPYSDWPGKSKEVSLRPDGVRQLYIQDPDGYWIEVNDAE